MKEKEILDKVMKLVKQTCEEVKKFTIVEREVFFNVMYKANIMMDMELCDNIVGVAFKKKQPQLKQFMGVLKDKLKRNIDIIKGIKGAEDDN